MQVWIGRNGERFGPYPESEVRAWLRDGTCRPDELGWYEGMTDWRPLGELFPDERPATATHVPPPPPPFMGVHDTVVAPEYAGFWLRFGAWVIDYLILAVPSTIVAFMMGMPAMMSAFLTEMQHDRTAAFTAYMEAIRPVSYVILVIGFLYYVAFEASGWQATPGKRAVGIRVTGLDGERISWARSAGRNAIRLVNAVSSLVPFVFYVTAAFTERKQGVHDMLARTYVVTGRTATVRDAPAPRPGAGDRFDA
jgi:uncharacterized RDD family membrane protein YckC